MNTSVINKLPLQTERKFRVLLCPMEVPSSLASADHRYGRASPGDVEQNACVGAQSSVIHAHCLS